ncbi:hypothetical protein FGU65_09265 [Methanoculleus sp. FWC-SCC1]|uniref:SIR2-like domain-containing protein n=1 Tax=Methanoculleus frigidifontis TaxID=2584085 RepID=A0ABT8MAW3_9EURY|nr:SIR2 family protein [Methanoculleus sp. FWC-SCC1]MDN7025073.1 hypothetical protein [Methanoculleus sp. FWC-SCC1]
MALGIEERLSDHLSQFETLPFLFVGSGLSKRYIGSESWELLLTKFSDRLQKQFSYYRSSAKGDLAVAGKLLAKDYHEYWFHNSDEHKIKSYEPELTEESSPLKIDISEYLLERSNEIKQDETLLKELDLLKRANVDGIITTNWDILLEELFQDYVTFIGQDELLNSTPQMIGEIYNIHGSCRSPNSIVLTSDDYDKFSKKNPYLIAKLLTIFIEHPVIFMGYSLQDDNIRNILNDVIACLSEENIKRMEKQLIFVEWDEENKGDAIYNDYSTYGGNTIPITVFRTDDFSAIFRALCSIERKIPTKILRVFKEQLYEIVKTNDPTDKINVCIDINNEEDLRDIRFVVGFGECTNVSGEGTNVSGEGTNVSKVGYLSIKVKHLIRDLIFDDLKCDPKEIIQSTWPNLAKSSGKYIPLFKYLREGGFITDDGILDGDLPPKVISTALKIASDEKYFDIRGYDQKRKDIREAHLSLPELFELYDTGVILYYIFLMNPEDIRTHDLYDYLHNYYEYYELEEVGPRRSFFRKLACLYDWLEYGNFEKITVAE